MLNPKTYASLLDAYRRIDATMAPGQERPLPALQLAHFPIGDTKLAACLIRLGVPWRQEGPVTDTAKLDAAGNEISRHFTWWLGEVSPPDFPGRPETAHKTEELQVAWALRERFEADHPTHPLVAMRAALDARQWWLSVLHAYRAGRAELPVEAPSGVSLFHTDKLHVASVLKASGFTPVAFKSPHFIFAGFRASDGQHAIPYMQAAAMPPVPGDTRPERWMGGVLFIYDALLKMIQDMPVIVSQKREDRTLLLTADAGESQAGRRNRDRFQSMLGT